MIKNLKISIALLLCTGFFFRILFVNIGVVSSLNTQQNNCVIKSHFSTVMKRSKHFEVLNNNFTKCEDSLPEICEENPDDDEQDRSNPFFLIQVLYSHAAGEIKNDLQKISLGRHNPYASSNRCLIFQTFRI
jgi:hypothetical protein